MVIGVLPGLGPAATIAILLPLTYGMDAVPSIIMLAGIFYGAIYGGTVTAVLLKLPGETSSAITALEGYPLAQRGQGGKALGVGAIASFIGGTGAIVVLTLIAPTIAGFALEFGPPEYAALTLLGILLVATISNGNMLKALAAAAVGLLLATVGRDGFTGDLRYTAGSLELTDGLQFVPIAMGVFGLAEILYNLERRRDTGVTLMKAGRVLPTRSDMRRLAGPISRGGVLGFFLGLLPGGGATVSAMASYGIEKRLNKGPTRFGQGAMQGVADQRFRMREAAEGAALHRAATGELDRERDALHGGQQRRRGRLGRRRHRQLRQQPLQGLAARRDAGAQHQRHPLHHVAQLAQVAGPGVMTQRGVTPGQGGAQRLRQRRVERRQRLFQKVFRQHRDIVAARPQWRQLQPQGAQAVKQIGAKIALLNRLLQAGVGGADDAKVDLYRLLPADPGDGFFFQRPQQPGLQVQRHFADLIQKQGAAVGGFQQPASAAAP